MIIFFHKISLGKRLGLYKVEEKKNDTAKY